MTIEALPALVPHTVSGIGPYAIGHAYTEGGLRAVVVATDGTATELVFNVDFSVVPAASTTNGDLYLNAVSEAAHAGGALYILRATAVEQAWAAVFSPREDGLEAQLNRLTMAVQELGREVSSAVRLEPYAGTLTAASDVAADRAGRLVTFSADGTEVATGPAGTASERAGRLVTYSADGTEVATGPAGTASERAGRLVTYSADGTTVATGPAGTASARAGRLIQYSGDGAMVQTGPTVDAVNAAVAASAMVIAAGSSAGFTTVADLKADDVLSYAPGDAQVSVGQTVHAQGHRFEVVASDATGLYLETAGGVRLLPLPDEHRFISLEQLAIDGTGATDVTTEVQAAINHVAANGYDLFCPDTYLVDTLTHPGLADDSRGNSLRIVGRLPGEAFITDPATQTGSQFISTTDSPIFQDQKDTAASSNGTFWLENIRLDGTSDTAPVLLLESFYGQSAIKNVQVYQRGSADGIHITYGPTTTVENVYTMNDDNQTYGLGLSRTGCGLRITAQWDGALLTLGKVTSRGWRDAFILDGDASPSQRHMYNVSFEKCECSNTYNGIVILNGRKTLVFNCFFEVGDGGSAIFDAGDDTTAFNNHVFPGWTAGINSASNDNSGSRYLCNEINLFNTPNAVGIDVYAGTSSHKVLFGNMVEHAEGTVGSIGLKIRAGGPTARVDYASNTLLPRAGWTGAGAMALDEDGLTIGTGIGVDPSLGTQFPTFNKGALSLFTVTLTETAVTSNVLAVPPDVSGIYLNPGSAVSINSVSGVKRFGQFLVVRTNANVTFNQTALINLAGGTAFSGAGTITFSVRVEGANTFLDEISRAAY
jgi:hypothetical protein